MGERNARGVRFPLLLKKRTETWTRRRKIHISLTKALAAETYCGKEKKGIPIFNLHDFVSNTGSKTTSFTWKRNCKTWKHHFCLCKPVIQLGLECCVIALAHNSHISDANVRRLGRIRNSELESSSHQAVVGPSKMKYFCEYANKSVLSMYVWLDSDELFGEGTAGEGYLHVDSFRFSKL